MIRFLHIRDLAIVDALECEFEPGFNVLTGETGAGKSIIVGALGLVAGVRGSADSVRTGAAKAVVQAALDTGSRNETIVRREVAAHGRGRVFVDDALVPIAALKALGGRFIDIHGQHEHQALLDARSHLDVVDAYGHFGEARAEVAARHEIWRRTRASFSKAEAGERDRTDRADFLAFQLAEIDRVAPEAGEDDRLRAERCRLANAERLQALSSSAYTMLYERDDSAMSTLAGVWRHVEELAALDPAFESHAGVRETVEPALDDVARALRSYAARIEASPDRLAQVESRLAEIERLAKKHGGTLDAVLEQRRKIAAELDKLSADENWRTELETETRRARDDYLTAARALSTRRAACAGSLATALQNEIRELAIANGRLEVRLESGLDEVRWSARGIDSAELFFSANPGEALRPLSGVASGGELSRVMLALKTIATIDTPGKTLVFDEVDAGIGGAAADRVGERLRALGERFQVLCVTHVPQLAAHAATHFRVSKEVSGGRTRVRIERLSDAQRVVELARLMAGRSGEAVLAGAGELLARTRRTEGERRKAKVGSDARMGTEAVEGTA